MKDSTFNGSEAENVDRTKLKGTTQRGQSMSQSWLIRAYKEGDERSICKLLKRTEKEWCWEYKNNPFGQFIGVAESNGRVIGHMALVPVQLKIKDEILLGAQAVDLVVHPDFRRQGIFFSIGRFLAQETTKRGIDFWYGFPNKLAHSGHLKYGWFDVCNVPLLIKPVNAKKAIQVFLDNYKKVKFLTRYRIARDTITFILRIILASVTFFPRFFIRIENKCTYKHFEIEKIKLFDVRIDDLWEKVSNKYHILVVRNRRYLNWRYLEKPNANYEIFIALKNNEVLGYMILKSKNENELKIGYIVDIFALPSDNIVIQSLISKAIEYFKDEKVDLIGCWMLKNGKCTRLYYKILRHFGFSQLFGRTHPLIARVNSRQSILNIVRDSKNWFVTMGDSDQI